MSQSRPVAFRAQEELDNIREYFEDRQDASMEPGEDRFHGNKEMSLLQDLERVENSIKALCNAISEAQSELRAAADHHRAHHAISDDAYAAKSLELLRYMTRLADEAHSFWDADMDSKCGKLLLAMAGNAPGYRADVDEIHAALAKNQRQGADSPCGQPLTIGDQTR